MRDASQLPYLPVMPVILKLDLVRLIQDGGSRSTWESLMQPSQIKMKADDEEPKPNFWTA